LEYLSILIGYLLGSFPSAFIVARVWGRIDLREEGDGHISAVAVHRNLGVKPLLLVILLDLAKGALVIYIARLLSASPVWLAAAGYAAVIGHSWSIFLMFKGGLGALVMFGVLVSLAPLEVGMGIGVYLLVLLFSRKTSISTYALLLVVSIALLVRGQAIVVVTVPIGIFVLQQIKRFQVHLVNPNGEYKDEALQDLKRKQRL